ncbi:hypothetical protein GCM10027610_054580 [Dactylosporangium cerinum]
MQRIPNQSPLAGPVIVSSGDVAVTGGSLSVPVTMVSGTDAYTVTLGNPIDGGTGGGPSIVDANAADFTYGANWGVTTGVADMYAGTANWSHVAGATATFRFIGIQVALRAVRDVDQGRMTVAVDGGAATTVDNYAATRTASGVVWTSPVLGNGPHTVTIVNTGQRNPASTGINIALDRADVTAAAPPSVIDGNDGRFVYSAGWGVATGIADMYAAVAPAASRGSTAATPRPNCTRLPVMTLANTPPSRVTHTASRQPAAAAKPTSNRTTTRSDSAAPRHATTIGAAYPHRPRTCPRRSRRRPAGSAGRGTG